MMDREFKIINRQDVSCLFPTLPENTHKGSMGRVLCVCGSYDGNGVSMCGAAYFSAMGAYKSGAGIVEIFTYSKNYDALASRVPEAIFSLYDNEENMSDVCERLKTAISSASAVIIGCGMGKSRMSREMLKCVLENVNCPLVIDADGLNIISENDEMWELLSREQRARTVITPHIGEMSRLTGKSISEITGEMVDTARSYAKSLGIICLLKSHNTIISDGETVYINQSGNAGMASGGMGDVLSGILGGILARRKAHGPALDKYSVLYSAAVGAYLHGMAGDMALEKISEYSLMASDVLSHISCAIKVSMLQEK